MGKKILVPLDGSRSSESALPYVERLGPDISVCLISVCGESEAAIERAQTYLRRVVAGVREKTPRVVSAILHGDPAAAILRYAMARRSDLIVLATHGRSGVRRLVFGSVAETLMRRSPAPLLLVRAKAAPTPLRRILVPLDGSTRARAILTRVATLARARGAHVLLLTAVPEPAPVDDLVDFLRDCKKELRARGIAAESRIDLGLPAQVILATAKRMSIDLIAMTTHGRTGLDRLRFGSVAESVLRHATIPLLVMRARGPRANRVAKRARSLVKLPGEELTL
ncbi:MAG: universal stress protein [Planctomycetes bacterium]|nr:universal stress protein [Planctomycetota bacterium]